MFQGFFLLPNPLIQIRHTLLNLLLNTADHFFLLSREFKEISVYRVCTAAINLGHLLWGEKLFLLNQSGADGKVLFGSCIVLHEIVTMTYALYMATLGNRPDLFPSSPYVGKYTNKPPLHEIPEDYLADETFAAILKEAEKYVGYPYVWGGSSPNTSFDCSGFVSYVYNQCGWDFGRLGAQGLYNISARTSSPKPGDLVFFTGTYDTPGISHVGIYVGDGWMLHCGDPISYANLNTSYWQSHFYAYGKLF